MLTEPILDLIACRSAFEAALSPDLSIEESTISDIEDGKTANKPDGIVGISRVYQGVISPFLCDHLKTIKQRRANYKQYCSAGTTQRCNFCANGHLYWRRCANNHRVSSLSLWLKYALTNTLQCTRTGHWCSWSDASGIAVCS